MHRESHVMRRLAIVAAWVVSRSCCRSMAAAWQGSSAMPLSPTSSCAAAP